MRIVRIGVIGTGIMGERHCRVCANLPRVELVGITDLNQDRGRLVAERYDTGYFPDREELLSQVEAITIATPTPSHYQLATECIERGIHVLVEKPITETIEEARRLVLSADRRSLVLQVGHIERFNPAFIELKHVTQGMSIIGMNVRRLSSFDASNTDVDVIRDLMIHDLDLVMDSIGLEIEEISARGCSVSSGHTDHAMATISFKDGPIATLTASRVTEHKIRSIDVTTTGAYIEADLLNKSVLVHRRTLPRYLDVDNTTQYRQESVIERIFVPSSEPLVLELRHFTDCVRENRPSQVPGMDGLRALQLAKIVADKVNRAQDDGDGYHEHLYGMAAYQSPL